MQGIKSIVAKGHCRHYILILSLLPVLLNGCADLHQKRVIPPPAKPTVGRPAESPGPVGKKRPPVVMPPREERSVVTRPPVGERPIVTEPPVEERPIVTPPPVEELPAVPESPAEYKPVTGRAAAIYNEAEEALQAENYASAEMLLERALRIEPRNAHYWYILGLAKFRQKQYPQAVQFCLKAESLAGSQPGLMARNRVLLTQAKKAAGAAEARN